MLGVAGIRAKLDIATGTQITERVSAGDYLFAGYGLAVPTQDPDGAVGTYFITGGSRNWFGYSNPEVDRLYLLMSSELDREKRKALFYQIRDIIVEQDVVVAFTQRAAAMQAFHSYVQGVTGYVNISSAASGFQRADRLWLKR